ncbi:hypothetical protein SeLEV6574_g06151 [Synchytrium endobioticum]|uniref:Uncharacterized protein n=1 Tax=Synchytrium endobioticum TaxID=286115 RepID=A0A507CQH1_9FUNG|nr:hypothetical protein SeLEV6574_g06151 [Synchytrium endobioticum]
MASLDASISNDADAEAQYELYEQYDFDGDVDFQRGVKSILHSAAATSEEGGANAILKARWFYYSKQVYDVLPLVSMWKTRGHGLHATPLLPIFTGLHTICNHRFVRKIDYEGYQSWKERRGDAQVHPDQWKTSAADTMPAESSFQSDCPHAVEGDRQPKYPRSFQELCSMVARGEPIPGIIQIPDKINEGTPSVPSLTPKKKPWERD